MSFYEFLYTENDQFFLIQNTTLILIDKPWLECTEDEKTLLSKILQSIKLSIQEVQIVFLPGATVDSLKIYSPKTVISFGVILSTTNDLYKKKITEGISLVQSDSLAILDDVRKKNLWNTLKQL